MERTRMSLPSRVELTRVSATRYQAAERTDKSAILTEFVKSTGYTRKYAISQLNKPVAQDGQERPLRTRQRQRYYDEAFTRVLIHVWEATEWLCSKRLVPYLPIIIPKLEQLGHLKISPSIRTRLLEVSPATVDRLLYEKRHGKKVGLGTTKPGPRLKHQIPIRTFADWDDERVGFLEGDTVAHCGVSMAGSFLNTLTLTDVRTGWTVCIGLLFKDAEYVVRAIRQAVTCFPFSIHGLDTDNGSEFITKALVAYCEQKGITFTRSRPYKKNDQCFVEQKNGSVVRRYVGHDRYEGLEAAQLLNELYAAMRLFVNFFQPSMRLLSKSRKGAKTRRIYDTATTPYARVLAANDITDAHKAALTRQYEILDPILIRHTIHQLQDQLWPLAYQGLPSRTNRTAYEPAKTPDVNPRGPQSRIGRRTVRRPKSPSTHFAFEPVWEECERMLIKQPNLAASQVLRKLQIKYPGRFKDSQLRSLQRRIRTWRLSLDYVETMPEPEGDSLPDISKIDLVVSSTHTT